MSYASQVGAYILITRPSSSEIHPKFGSLTSIRIRVKVCLMRWQPLCLSLIFLFVNAVFASQKDAQTKSPQDGDVCFTPDDPCDQKIVQFIDGAQKSIDVAAFDISLDQFAHRLILKSKDVKVRVIVDGRQINKDKKSAVPLLLKGNVNLKIGRQRGYMHDKFVIVDGTMIETGSFNFTVSTSWDTAEI